jgi:8-oxo-dGTP diphosphatase
MKLPTCHYRVSVKALVVKQGQVLLVREGSERWDLPGGGLEHEEDVQAGLRRELSEELGTDVTIKKISLFHVYKAFDPVNDRPVIALIYRVEVSDARFTAFPPVYEIKSFTDTELVDICLEPYAEALRPVLLAGIHGVSQVLP